MSIPRRVPAHCERCGHAQVVRNLQPIVEQPCSNCGRALTIHQVRLKTTRQRRSTRRTVDTSFRRRLSAATMLLIYAVVLAAALAWVIRHL